MAATAPSQSRGAVLCLVGGLNCWVEQAHLLQSKVGIPGWPHSWGTSARTRARGSAASNLLKKHNQQHPDQQQQEKGKKKGETQWESRAGELECA